MNIYLYGPSGSGKTTTAIILAEKLKMQFFDLDAEIEKFSSTPITSLFERGEAYFRELEHQVFTTLHEKHSDCIISLGGGALLDTRNRQIACIHGQVVYLSALPDVLLSRLKSDDQVRPLLNSNPEQNLMQLLLSRQSHYSSFGNPIDTSALNPDEIAEKIQISLGIFRISGMQQSYKVEINANSLMNIGERLRKESINGPFVLVCDENIQPLYSTTVLQSLKNAGLKCDLVVIPPGEKNKSITTISNIWQSFVEFGVERKTTILALGGGVTGDLTGFAAATFLRGLPWVNLPTTLLSMVDSSLGGKTGADLPQGKNLIGAFHSPRLVITDPSVLTTLPYRELRNGMAEMVKHSIVADPDLFNRLRSGWPQSIDAVTSLISQAVAVKVNIIERDPFETGLRQSLNFGHSVGHGVELASEFRIGHGEAVALGMVSEARLAEKIHLAKSGLCDELSAVLTHLGLETQIPRKINRNTIIAAMKLDKKKEKGQIHFALPVEIGHVQTGVTIDNWENLIEL